MAEPIGATLRSFSQLALPVGGGGDYIRMLEWLDGARALPKYLIMCLANSKFNHLCPCNRQTYREMFRVAAPLVHIPAILKVLIYTPAYYYTKSTRKVVRFIRLAPASLRRW